VHFGRDPARWNDWFPGHPGNQLPLGTLVPRTGARRHVREEAAAS
jgi:hypothetical protein